jgi:hypothetical protein
MTLVGLVHQEFCEEVLLAECWQGRQPSETLRAAIATEARRQPRLHQILISKVGRLRIDDRGPWVDASFDRIGSDDLLTEPVNRRAGQLIKRLVGRGYRC